MEGLFVLAAQHIKNILCLYEEEKSNRNCKYIFMCMQQDDEARDQACV